MTTPKRFLHLGEIGIAVDHIVNVQFSYDNGATRRIVITTDAVEDHIIDLIVPQHITAFLAWYQANSDIPRVAKSSTDSIAHAVLLIDALRERESFHPVDETAMRQAIFDCEEAIEAQKSIDSNAGVDMVALPLRRLADFATPLRDFDDNVRDVLDVIAS